MADRLRLVQTVEGEGYRVEVALVGADGGERSATARFAWELTGQDRERIRWYLEDYLLYPIDPAPEIAARVEARVAEIGQDLFAKVFDANRDTIRLWDQVADRLPDVRVEVVTTVEGATAIPWELLRDPATDKVVTLRAREFMRCDPRTPQTPVVARAGDVVRVLLVICRPGGASDVPFRSVASHLVRLSRTAREAFQLDVLRPATFAQLARGAGGGQTGRAGLSRGALRRPWRVPGPSAARCWGQRRVHCGPAAVFGAVPSACGQPRLSAVRGP